MKKAKFYANHKVKVMLVVVMSCRDDNAHDVMIIVFIVDLDVVKMYSCNSHNDLAMAMHDAGNITPAELGWRQFFNVAINDNATTRNKTSVTC